MSRVHAGGRCLETIAADELLGTQDYSAGKRYCNPETPRCHHGEFHCVPSDFLPNGRVISSACMLQGAQLRPGAGVHVWSAGPQERAASHRLGTPQQGCRVAGVPFGEQVDPCGLQSSYLLCKVAGTDCLFGKNVKLKNRNTFK